MKVFSRFFLVALSFLLFSTSFLQAAHANETSAYDVYSQALENPLDVAEREGDAVNPATVKAQPSLFRVTADGQLVPAKKGSITQPEVERTSGWCTRSTVTECNYDVCDCGCSCGTRACSCYKY